MKQSRIFIIAVVFTMVISACGAQAKPTANPADVQGTAMAAAFTVVAQTQAAIPTNTPVPPTGTPSPTPLPTETSLPSPVAPISSATPSSDPCNGPLTSSISGPMAKINIVNESGYDIGVWFYVNITPFGDCGYATIPAISKGGDYSFFAPEGCYAAGAWTTGKKNINIDNVRYPLCANNNDKWTLHITENEIFLTPP